MSLQDFQLLDNEPLDKSIIKRVFTKIYNRKGDQLNHSDQNVEFVFGENNNYHQIGNAYLEINIIVRKNDDTNFHHEEPVRLVNNGYAFCFKEARLGTTNSRDIEINKFCGQVSTIMRAISNKDGDLLSQFDNINENDIPKLERLADLPPQIRSTPHQKMLINNHIDANRGKYKGYLCLEDIFGFCKTLKKVTKNLGFHLTCKTNDLQNIIYSSMADDIDVTINNLYLYVPNIIQSVENQVMFNEATQNNYKITFDEGYTERRVTSDTITQLDIGSSQNVQSLKHLTSAQQTRIRADTANKNYNKALFDNLNLQKYYDEIDSVRYPRESVLVYYEQNDYFEQYKELKLFFKEYIGEELMSPFKSYPDMKTKYPIEIRDSKHQSDHITPKKTQRFQEYSADPENAKFNSILIRRREIELISDGNKLIEIKVIQNEYSYSDNYKYPIIPIIIIINVKI